jgi:S-sulfosulfanyl-L-cysteine sulfohydrolase
VLEPLNALGIDVATPGNWEVVYGPARFRSLLTRTKYPLVCYNFHDTATGKRIFAPAAVQEKSGIRVAFVGLTDPTTTTRQAPAEVAGLDSTRIAGLRNFVQNLKLREKPDLMVLVDHTGLAPSVQLAQDIPEFDIVLSGHTHERVYKPIRVGKSIVVEPGSLGSFVGRLDVTVADGTVSDVNYELVKVDANRYAENPVVKAIVAKAEAPFEKRLREVVGRAAGPLLRYDVLESSMDNVIADAVRDATHADIALTNGFRFSPPIATGPITEADLWNMLPFDAKLKVGHVSGKLLEGYLENEMELVFARDPFSLSGGWGPRPAGMTVRFEARANNGSRIRNVLIDRAPLDRAADYTLGGCERDGEPLDVICRLRGVRQAIYVAGTVHSALRAYLKGHSPISPRSEKRVQAVDLPSTVWSQYSALQRMWHLPGDAAASEIPR